MLLYRVLPLLRESVAVGCGRWTNNGCESINHQLKLAVNWQPNKLPELINKLRRLVDTQYVDADRAVLRQGNFALKPQYTRHRVTVADWKQMSKRQRQRLTDYCFRLPSDSNAPSPGQTGLSL